MNHGGCVRLATGEILTHLSLGLQLAGLRALGTFHIIQDHTASRTQLLDDLHVGVYDLFVGQGFAGLQIHFLHGQVCHGSSLAFRHDCKAALFL